MENGKQNEVSKAEKSNSVKVTVEIDLGRTMGQVEELVNLLKAANSQVDELAASFSNLELNIKA